MSYQDDIRLEMQNLAEKSGFISDNMSQFSEKSLNSQFYEYVKSKKINIDKIPVYAVESEKSSNLVFKDSGKTLKTLIPKPDKILLEYILTVAEKGVVWDAPIIEDGYYVGNEYSDFNALSVDLAYEDSDIITLIESKIGAEETFKTPRDNFKSAQFARYADWLIAAKYNSERHEKNLIILSSKEFYNKQKYITELNNVLNYNNRRKQINGYLIAWEDIFSIYQD